MAGGTPVSETTSADPVKPGSSSDVSDSEYLLQLGVQPRFKRALGFFTEVEEAPPPVQPAERV